MRLDHVSYAAEPDGLQATAERIGRALGVAPVDGGLHPRFGTRNVVVPLADRRYVEVVDVLDHPTCDKAPFGQAVRGRCESGGGWLGWVVSVDDLAPIEARLERRAVPGNRHRPDGVELRWRQIGVRGLIADPQLPFMICWERFPDLHPSTVAATDVRLEGVTIAGHPDRVRDWLRLSPDYSPDCINFTFTAPKGTPGLLSVSFDTPHGLVEI